MCFSATASFTASAALATIGLLTLTKTKIRHEWMLASVPLLFAIQQLTEGLLWLALKRGVSFGPYWPTQVYALFVGVVWPILIPLGVLLTEPNRKRQLFVGIPLLLGIAIAFYSLRSLAYDGVTAHIEHRCILYETPAYSGIYVIAAYVVATCAAFFFSTQRSMVRIGWINAAAFIAAFIFYRVFLSSPPSSAGFCTCITPTSHTTAAMQFTRIKKGTP
jgi:hypothetical protein